MSQSINVPLPPEPGVLVWTCRSLMAQELYRVPAARWAEENRAPAACQRILHKGNIPAGVTDNETWAGAAAGDFANAVAAFLPSLANASVFFSILAGGGFVRVPINRRIVVATTGAAAYTVGSGRPLPLSRLTLAHGVLVGESVAADIVVSEEVIIDTGASGQEFFANELRQAIGVHVDAQFFLDCLTSNSEHNIEEISASGTDAASAWAAMKEALGVVGAATGSRLYWLCSPDVAIALATLSTDTGIATFETVGVDGGQLLGRPLLVSSGIGTGIMVLVNAARICADADQIGLRASKSATVEMNNTPVNDSSVPTATSLVSMYQTNCVAARADVRVACELMDENAVCRITDIAWGSGASA